MTRSGSGESALDHGGELNEQRNSQRLAKKYCGSFPGAAGESSNANGSYGSIPGSIEDGRVPGWAVGCSAGGTACSAGVFGLSQVKASIADSALLGAGGKGGSGGNRGSGDGGGDVHIDVQDRGESCGSSCSSSSLKQLIPTLPLYCSSCMFGRRWRGGGKWCRDGGGRCWC
jgi:hypothetical protein